MVPVRMTVWRVSSAELAPAARDVFHRDLPGPLRGKSASRGGRPEHPLGGHWRSEREGRDDEHGCRYLGAPGLTFHRVSVLLDRRPRHDLVDRRRSSAWTRVRRSGSPAEGRCPPEPEPVDGLKNVWSRSVIGTRLATLN